MPAGHTARVSFGTEGNQRAEVDHGHDADGGGTRRRVQRVAAYAVCVRDGRLLLAQLSERTANPGSWTLPGGGIDHGEPPRQAVVREFREETGLEVEVGPLLDVDSLHVPHDGANDYHSVRLVFVGWVASSETPRVLEIDGSTAASAWIDLADVASGAVPVTSLVVLALQWLSRFASAGR